MRKYENECCDCATPTYPCIGESCNLRHVLHYYCDKCHIDIDEDEGVYNVDGDDLCLDCLKEKFRKDFA